MTDRRIGEQWMAASASASASAAHASPHDQLQQPSFRNNEEQDERKKPHLSAAQRFHRTRLILSTFSDLRKKCDIPHPSWILINPLLQLPPFVATGVALRMMAMAHWPGLETQGALWFNDLTLAPIVIETMEQPMGPTGFILPSILVAMTLTSLRMGFGASGASRLYQDHEASVTKQEGEKSNAAGGGMDPLGTFLIALPPVLYSLAILNGYFKVQLPHAALIHWLAASAFTLGLQIGLKNKTIRSVSGIPTPEQIHLALKSASSALTNSFASSGSAAKPQAQRTYPMQGPLYSSSTLPHDIVTKVTSQGMTADVLVVLGAQLSAKHRYPEALYCLDKALLLLEASSGAPPEASSGAPPEASSGAPLAQVGREVHHVRMRVHYSRGQVFSLVKRWDDAEECYRSAKAEAEEGSLEKAQSLHCIATCLHQQGKLDEAVEEYRRAIQAMPKSLGINRMALIFSLANALSDLKRWDEAKETVKAAREMGKGPFDPALDALETKISDGTNRL